ncbi:hypothetical protein CRG98_016530 [Punica granatum]|uniref:Uncharacterized protein n=1 Tax=Punica granatum TaxID=22663 RepID=A0A2I0K3E9_PUNGR|nr:hypothetical protein CRG98_016530 [Punica granatum]
MDDLEGLARLDSRLHLISRNSGRGVEVLFRSLPDRLIGHLALLGFLHNLGRSKGPVGAGYRPRWLASPSLFSENNFHPKGKIVYLQLNDTPGLE